MPLGSRLLAVTSVALALAVTTGPAAADEFDMDCKMILCLAGGFPSGCEDAWRHLIDRLRDGKSPVDSCTMADGRELDDVDAEVRRVGAHSASAWSCPAGARLHHEAEWDGERRRVTAFCYEAATERRQGDGFRTSYIGVSTPARVDLEAQLRMAPGTAVAYDSGLLRFHTGRPDDPRTLVSHRP